MPFVKGQSGNNKGREKGTGNKVTTEARELFLKTLESQVEHIPKAFTDVRDGVYDDDGIEIIKPNPEQYLDLFAKYAQYFVPKKTENSDTVKHEFPTQPNRYFQSFMSIVGNL